MEQKGNVKNVKGHETMNYLLTFLKKSRRVESVVEDRKNGKDIPFEDGTKNVAIKEKVLGTNHTETATTYYDNGRVYFDKEKYDAALEVYEKSLAIQLEKYGTNHPRPATLYSHINWFSSSPN